MGKVIRRFLLVEAQKFWTMGIPVLKVQAPFDGMQPLGLILLAAVIRRWRPDAEIRILDLRLLRNDYSAVPELLKSFNPDFVGFRGISSNAKLLSDMARLAGEILPGAVLVGGGPHVTALKGKALEETQLDYGVYGEGEDTLIDLLEHLEQGGGFESVPGLIFRSRDGITVNPPRAFIKDLDSLPMPAWDLLDLPAYFDLMETPHLPIFINVRREVCFLFTSRACPYRCYFCHDNFGKKFRAQSAEKVVDEIEHLYHRYGARQFAFMDDIFNWDGKRVHRICDLIIERGLDVKLDFPNGVRGDIMDEALVLKLKAAGMFHVAYAPETASPRLQKMIGKRVDLEKLRHIIHFTSAQDVLVRLNLMLGFPTETREELLKSLNYALDPAVDLIMANTIHPNEGNEMTELLKRHGVNVEEFNERQDYASVTFSVCELTAPELQTLRENFLIRFFSDARVATTLRKIRSHSLPAR